MGFAQENEPAPFLLSPRVGETLDSVEVEYFSIFPDLDGVKSVVYRKDNFDNLQMLVSLFNGKDTTLLFSPLAIPELQTLINQYEKIPDNRNLVKWNLLPGMSASKLNYFENVGRKAVVYTTHGKFTGRLLTFRDSAIYLWQKQGSFMPEPGYQRFIKKISPDSIRKIRLKPSVSSKVFGASLGAGVALGLLGFGYNLTGSSDYLLSSNSLVLLGIGAGAGSVIGVLADGAMRIGRVKTINGNRELFREAAYRWGSRAMFHRIYPPELKNLP